MPANPRRTMLALVAFIVSMAACEGAEKASDIAVAPAPAPVLPPFRQEIVSAKAEVTFPGVWKDGYQMLERADTTLGSSRAIEFRYVGDSARKVPSRRLLVIRAFKKAAWEKIATRQPPLATKLAEHGNDVYAYSIVTSNPYPANTASALRVDAMMLALIADGGPFKLSFK
jgi:hypothetical protein